MIKFTIEASAYGKGRGRNNGRGGVYTPRATVIYERMVKAIAVDWMRRHNVGALLSGALSLDLDVRVAPPRSATKKARGEMLTEARMPTVKPDCSNIAKAIEDAINKTAYHDDVQITRLVVTKRYAVTAGVDVTIMRIGRDHKGDPRN